ncbi:MAG: GntR family transcriptional regulator [Noviherbaspirillum sp.]
MGDALLGGISPGTPLYKEVKRKITESMRDGEWKPGETIPSEKALCARFGVSIGTLRKAVDELTSENLLIRHQGRGTFVASHNRERLFFHFFHIVPHDGEKEYPHVELVEFAESRADTAAAGKLGIATGAEVFRFVNRLSIGGRPAIVDEITVPASLFPGLTESHLRERPNTLYHFYQESYGVSVLRTEERLRAAKASAAHARILDIPEGEPLLQIIRVALSYRDQPVELRFSYVDTRDYEYFCQREGSG